MERSLCMCVYKQFIDEPITVSSTIMDFLFSAIITACGLLANTRFRAKLQEEKRNRLPGRKGNVIEPIMNWYLILAMAFWPYQTFFYWTMAHEVFPSEWFRNCWLMNLTMRPIAIGRMIIACNSFFVALIRYLYIVHRRKASKWNFEKIGKIFRLASFTIPIAIITVVILTQVDVPGLKNTNQFKECVATSEGLNTTLNIHIPPPSSVEFMMKYLPRQIIDVIYYIAVSTTIKVCGNIPELYLYLRIFQTIKRYETIYLYKNRFCLFHKII